MDRIISKRSGYHFADATTVGTSYLMAMSSSFHDTQAPSKKKKASKAIRLPLRGTQKRKKIMCESSRKVFLCWDFWSSFFFGGFDFSCKIKYAYSRRIKAEELGGGGESGRSQIMKNDFWRDGVSILHSCVWRKFASLGRKRGYRWLSEEFRGRNVGGPQWPIEYPVKGSIGSGEVGPIE